MDSFREAEKDARTVALRSKRNPSFLPSYPFVRAHRTLIFLRLV